MELRCTSESLESRCLLAGGAGLQADYFDGRDLSHHVLTRTDATVNFDWSAGAPDAAVPADGFSVRWDGRVQPKHSEAYTFHLKGNGGARLWVNGQKLIDDWASRGSAAERSGTIALVGGRKYDIVVEYFDDAGAASATLSWSSASQAKQVIPAAQLFPSERGSLLREYWSGVTGSTIADLTGRATYPNTPSGAGFVSSFEAPTNFADSYGQRIRGYVHAPKSGYYTFHVAGDNAAELYLSNGSDPANKRLIASAPTFTGSRQWDKFASQKSARVYLLAGQKYYIEALHKENTSSDSLAVAWTLPDGTFEGPIAGRHLSPVLPEVRISADEHNTSETDPRPATFTVTRRGGSNALPLVVNYTTGGAATNGADYQALSGQVTIPAGQASAKITLTPINDTTVEAMEEKATIALAEGAGYTLPPDAFAGSSATIRDEDSLPTTGVPVFPADYMSHYYLSGTPQYATRQDVNVSGMPFTRAIQVTIPNRPPSVYSVQLNGRTTSAVNERETLYATFYARAVGGPKAKFAVVFERTSSPFEKSLSENLEVGPQWQKFELPFDSAQTYAPNTAQLNFQLGYEPQTLQIGGISLTNYRTSIAPEALPTTVYNYVGRDAAEAWRDEAQQRIDDERKGNLNVVVRDVAGNVIEGALVSARMREHGFGFGSAVVADALADTSANGDKYRAIVKELFNKAVLENDLKWPQWQTARLKAINAVNWLVGNGIDDIRGHALVWPSWRWIPSSTGAQNGTYKTIAWSNTPERPASQQEYEAHVTADGLDTAKAWLRNRILTHITEEAGSSALKGKITEWDVMNEAYGNHQIQDILGSAEMTEWFKRAKLADPAAQLFINDYPSLAGSTHLDFYENQIRSLLASGAPIEGIGFQGHFGSDASNINDILSNLDRFGAIGKPLQITEFDMETKDEQYQADFLRDFLTATFSHEAIEAFTVWGFWQNRHWQPNAALYRSDFSIKPNGQQYKDLVFGDWWTDAYGTTGSDGRYATRGFAGKYDVTASFADFAAAPLSVDLTTAGKDVTVTLNALFLQGTGGNDTFTIRREPLTGTYLVWHNAATTLPATHVVPADASIVIDAGAGDDTLVFDLLGGATIPAGTFRYTGGDGTDAFQVVGSPAAETFSIDHDGTTFGTGTVHHPGVESINVDPTGASKGGVILGLPANDSVTVGGSAQVTIPAAQTLTAFTLSGTAAVTLSGPTLKTSSLSLTGSPRLDLGSGNLIIDGGDLGGVANLVKSSRNSTPRWSGTGITSSAAAANPMTGLAAMLNPGLVTFSGEVVDRDDVLVTHTYNGDANLDGRVNSDDYFRIDSGFLAPPTDPGYRDGDFNYDGKINSDDYFLIDSAFLGQGAPLGGGGDPSPLAMAAVSSRLAVADEGWAGDGGQREPYHVPSVVRPTAAPLFDAGRVRRRARGR